MANEPRQGRSAGSVDCCRITERLVIFQSESIVRGSCAVIAEGVAAMVQMNIHTSADVRFAVGYFAKGESIDNASVGTKFKNWLAETAIGKNLFKMTPPKCLCVRDARTGQHVATGVTTARFGRFVKADLSGTRPSKVQNYTPPPSTKNVSLEDRGSGAVNVDRVHGPVKNDQELATAKQEIADGFKKDFWNRDQMSIALYAKMTSREVKEGPPIRGFVTQFNPDDAKTCETGKLLQGLKDQLDAGKLKEGQRFQMAVQNGAHWTAIDAKIMNGEPHFFVMDAAQQATSELVGLLTEKFPKSTVYEYNDRKVNQLQFDDNSCSRFTLDHLSVMSRDEGLFERLAEEAAKNTFRNIDHEGGKNFMVPTQHLPSGALRLLQSHSTLDKVDDELKDRISSPGKQKTEYQQALANTVIDFEREKIMNVGVEAKKESMAGKATEFLNSMTQEQFNKVMTYRSGEGLLF